MEEAEGLAKCRTPEEMKEGEIRVAMTLGGTRNINSQTGTQCAARTMAPGRVEGGRSHGEDLAVDTRGMMNGDGADRGVEPMEGGSVA